MINLLSPEDKRQLAAARTNSLLVRYVVLLGMLIFVLVAEMVGAYFVLDSSQAANQVIIDENRKGTLAYADTKRDLNNFTTNLSTAKYILNLQAPYTSIILRIAANLPTDSALDRITIDPSTFGTPGVMTVRTTSYDSAINVKTSLQKSGIFSDVSFQSISQSQDEKHPYTATYNITYSKDLLKQ